MIESLESIDRQLVLIINGAHFEILDSVMWFFSGPYVVIPLSILVLGSLYMTYSIKQIGLLLLSICIGIALADFCSVHFFKDMFMRYRPSHHAELMGKLHFHEFSNGEVYQGGLYGFVSSHAANYFTLLILCWSVIKHKWVNYTLLTITFIIVYSRVYLGVHYLTDIFFGAILGYIVAKLVLHFLILKRIKFT